jgi:hypothetical protein
MVPNISANGRSFRGAGAYHLHDKPSADRARPHTARRVAFTATRNLANDDPHAALDEMWRTAQDAAYLKAGGGASPRGRRSLAPVKSISLAWAPGQTPTHEHMAAAADAFLRAMGWHQHQAILVAHSDTAHPHLHIILNRVHPDTGRTLNDWQERKRAQAWALAYERQHEAVLCTGRVLRDGDRQPATPAGLPHRQAKLMRTYPSSDRYEIARAHRAHFRPAWVQQFRRHRASLAELGRERCSVQRRVLSLAREGNGPAASRILAGFQKRYQHTLRSLSTQRAALSRRQFAALSSRLRHSGIIRSAANDNAIAVLRRPYNAPQPSGRRFRNLPGRCPDAAINLRSLADLQRGERRQLLAMQAAAYAHIRRHPAAAAAATALARSEILVTFAGRWAEIRRLPPELRAPAAAALEAQQAAALSARIRHHLGRLTTTERTQPLGLPREHARARQALACRHRLAWAAAAAALRASRPARAPPLRAAGSSNPAHAPCP